MRCALLVTAMLSCAEAEEARLRASLPQAPSNLEGICCRYIRERGSTGLLCLRTASALARQSRQMSLVLTDASCRGYSFRIGLQFFEDRCPVVTPSFPTHLTRQWPKLRQGKRKIGAKMMRRHAAHSLCEVNALQEAPSGAFESVCLLCCCLSIFSDASVPRASRQPGRAECPVAAGLLEGPKARKRPAGRCLVNRRQRLQAKRPASLLFLSTSRSLRVISPSLTAEVRFSAREHEGKRAQPSRPQAAQPRRGKGQ